MPATRRRAAVIANAGEQPEPAQEDVREGGNDKARLGDRDRNPGGQEHDGSVRAVRDEREDADRHGRVDECSTERRRLKPGEPNVDPEGNQPHPDEHRRHVDLPHGFVIGIRCRDLKPLLPSTFAARTPIDGSMKMKNITLRRSCQTDSADLVGSVRAFLEVSRAAREPVEPQLVRERIVQDPLRALSERLAAV